MKHILHLKHSLALAAMAIFMLLPGLGWGQPINPPVQSIPYSQNFGTVIFTSMPTGWAWWNGVSGASVNSQALAEASIPNGNATISSAAAVQSTGGSYGYATLSNARPYVQTSSNTTNGVNQLAIALSTSGLTTIIISYDVEIISAQTRTVGIVMQYRVGHIGTWTTINGTGNPFSQSGGTTGVKVTPSLTLPSGADNQSEIQIRWAIWRGTEAGNSAGIAIDNISIIGTAASTPIITLTPATLTNFSYIFGSGPSAEKTFTVSGVNLTGDIALVPPTDYEISIGTGGAFVATNPITLTQSGGAVSTTTIYARLKAGLAVGNYNNENIVASSAGATDQNVNCSGLVTMNYYSAASGNLDEITSWGTNTDGTGSNPSDFSTDGQVFNIRNNATPTIGATWAVSGIGSKVVLGDGTNAVNFTIPSSYIFSGTIDLSANSTITIQNTAIPTFGTINPASTVVYDGGTQNITQTTYGNLTLSSAGAKTFAGNTTTVSGNLILDNTTLNAPGALPFATLSLGGNLTYIGTVTPPVDGSSITLITTGPGTQTITGNGNTARWFRLQTTNSTNNVVLSEAGGSTDLYVGNLSGGGINLATGSQLTLNGNTLTFFNGNGSIQGLGTITCTVSSNIIINKTGAAAFGTLRLTPGSETLNNITLNMTGTGNTVTLGSVLTVNGNLTITSGIFVVAEGSQLTVNGTLTNSAGVTGLVVESGGSLIESTVGVSATVERDVNAWTNALHGWHLLSSPVQNQAIAPAFTSSPATDYDFYQWGEVTNTWLNQKDAANNIINFVPGNGYLVAYANADTKQFSGVLNDTNFLVHNLTLSTGTNAGWNLLGNPYPSALKWNDGSNWTVPATFGSIAKVWDEGDAGYDDINPNDLIPAMNGFMVQVVSGSPASLIIPGSARVHDATDTWYKSSEGLLKLIAHDLDNSTAQESIIRMNGNATEGFDSEYDSHFLAGFAPKFYSTAGSEQFSTNSLPGIDNSRIIPMGFVKNAAGNFSIQLMENSLTGVPTIYLTDNKTGIITNMGTTPVYNFTSVAGDDANRFLLKFQETASITDPDVTKDFTVHAENGVITILQTGNLSGNVTVTDMAGRTVATASLIAGTPTSISLQGHPGVYVVSIVTAEGVSNVKVIVS